MQEHVNRKAQELGIPHQVAIQKIYEEENLTPEFRNALRAIDMRNEEARDRILHHSLWNNVLTKMTARKSDMIENVGLWMSNTTNKTYGKDKSKIKQEFLKKNSHHTHTHNINANRMLLYY